LRTSAPIRSPPSASSSMPSSGSRVMSMTVSGLLDALAHQVD
jgi:hypothetical protein